MGKKDKKHVKPKKGKKTKTNCVEKKEKKKKKTILGKKTCKTKKNKTNKNIGKVTILFPRVLKYYLIKNKKGLNFGIR
jgi:hypothetical protein